MQTRTTPHDRRDRSPARPHRRNGRPDRAIQAALSARTALQRAGH
ncbi:MAG TPA: hypothetical protein VFT70_07395 [Nocardioides sp.]|nr:hypothetical protein [Nocardioides sp.]